MTRNTMGALVARATLMWTVPALAVDYCKVDFAGGPYITYLPWTVEGSYSGNAWGNSSARRVDLPSHGMQGFHLRAVDSPVALYVYTGDDFTGSVAALYCAQGYECYGSWNVSIESFSCQREFAHKGLGDAALQMSNPVIDTSEFVAPISEAFVDQVAADPGIEQYENMGTDLRWTTIHTYEKTHGMSPSWSDRYADLLQIHKAFNVNPDVEWWEEFVVWTYDVEVDIFMAPVLDDEELHFWWAGTDIWVEEGNAKEQLSADLGEGLAAFDSQAMFDQGIREEAGTQVVLGMGLDPEDFTPQALQDMGAAITDGKERLQLSHVAGFAGASVWGYQPWSSTSTLEPSIVLNADRSN